MRRPGIMLTEREKRYLFTGILLLAAILCFQFVLIPLWENRSRLDRSLEASRKTFSEIKEVAAEYRKLAGRSVDAGALIAARPPGFTLFSFVEEQAGKAAIKPYIKSMKPSTGGQEGNLKETSVELKIEGLSLEQLVAYLYFVEDPRYLVTVKRIQIKRGREEALGMDVQMQVVTYERGGTQ
ncbi:MAG: type II secretion system protein M [Deltaproteobacteria bacterium]|nr:type II secretion system protein M [Deltaproteobacteria bacterium]